MLLPFLLRYWSRYWSCCWVNVLLWSCQALLLYWLFSWYLIYALEPVLGGIAYLHATPYVDTPSRRSWTTCVAELCCRNHFMIPVVTRTLAEHKTREESFQKDKKRGNVFDHTCTSISFLVVD